MFRQGIRGEGIGCGCVDEEDAGARTGAHTRPALHQHQPRSNACASSQRIARHTQTAWRNQTALCSCVSCNHAPRAPAFPSSNPSAIPQPFRYAELRRPHQNARPAWLDTSACSAFDMDIGSCALPP
ncbi:hypothetical protein T484DRAFT_1979438 [Baffinella frigidus]|nr:hypothetical protein T484DRAFT_1979438 [Cryptophyta sp. CCMP2293]